MSPRYQPQYALLVVKTLCALWTQGRVVNWIIILSLLLFVYPHTPVTLPESFIPFFSKYIY